jgi:hypothetical protein
MKTIFTTKLASTTGVDELLAEMTRQGWEFVSIVMASPNKFLLIFKKTVS